MNNRKQAMQKPPPGIVFIEDYLSEDGKEQIAGIATRLGLIPSSYRKWRMAGKGPLTFMLGKRVAARIEDVDAWVAEQYRAGVEPSEDERPPEPLVPTQQRRARRQPVTAGR